VDRTIVGIDPSTANPGLEYRQDFRQP